MLEVRRLRLLRELAVRGTIADVATALHQSPSSVSQQLSQLEKEVGVELLRKAGRRLQLTPQAQILVEHTAVILQRLEEAESDLLASLDDATGRVRIAVFQSAALALMPNLIPTLATQHPRLHVTVTQREPETALHETFARDFDLVIAEQYPNHAAPWHPELDRIKLTHDAIRLAVPPTPDWAHIRQLHDTASVPWVMEPHSAASRHFAEQACRQAGFEPDVRFETADLTAQINLIEAGNAVAFIPDLMWARHEPPVRLIDLAEVPLRTVFTATRKSTAQRPSIIACRDALAAVVAGLGTLPRSPTGSRRYASQEVVRL